MALVFLDLDNTLIKGDSDYLWGEFLVSRGLVDSEEYQKTNLKFYEDYNQGVLDYDEYLKFVLDPLLKHQTDELLALNHDFMETIIRPIVYKSALELIEDHQKNKDRVVIHSSTNSFIVAPIARMVGVQEIISTQLEFIGEQYTGRYIGLPNYGENKVKNIYQWMKKNKLPKSALKGSYAYSDSFNDLPLLCEVEIPVAVNADEKLSSYALNCGWRIINFDSRDVQTQGE
jgi:HAD superfamily hydrolase (TIGR01490 family)